MRLLLVLLFIHFLALPVNAKPHPESPLAIFSAEWNDAKYLQCNTAANVTYMSDSEKKVIYVLNLVRANPKLFCESVLKYLPEVSSRYDMGDSVYYYSLVVKLSSLEPLGLLYPDSACAASAYGHASSSGQVGYTGHVRQTDEAKKVTHFMGECCDYGHNSPFEIILALLVDHGIPSLGHRQICLGEYSKIGVSIQPHTKYNYTSTLDFFK